MQDVHLTWLADHPLDTAQDTWRAESAAFAYKQDVQPLVQLAILHTNGLADGVGSLLLKWGYVLKVQTAYKRSVTCKYIW